MRFSLVSLLLFTIWVGAALGVWLERSPWVVDRITPVTAAEMNSPEDLSRSVAPDGRRGLMYVHPASTFFSIIQLPVDFFATTIYTHDCTSEVTAASNIRFENDDFISLVGPDPKTGNYVSVRYRRRFPEGLTGQFQRPAVWAFVLITIILLIRGIQALRRGRRARAV
jgi:hypothetical protein